MRALCKCGLEVHVAHMQGGPNADLARASGARLHRLPVAGNYDPRTLMHLMRLLKRDVRPSIVQTWLLHADVFGGTAARLSGVPWVLSERASGTMYADGMKNRVRRLLGLRADAIVANSRAGLEYWMRAGYEGPGRVIRNIVEHEAVAAGHRDDPPSSDVDGESIVIIGRLEEQKNPRGVLGVLERVFADRPDVRAHFLGTGSMEAELHETVERAPLLRHRVRFHGFVADVAPWLQRASALFSYSRYEGTPNVVLEAIAQGCPTVVSDIPEHLELLGAANSWIAPLADPAAAASALLGAIADEEESQRRAGRARALLADFEEHRIAGQYRELYQALIERRTASAGVRK